MISKGVEEEIIRLAVFFKLLGTKQMQFIFIFGVTFK
jgi:hypothetical protein